MRLLCIALIGLACATRGDAQSSMRISRIEMESATDSIRIRAFESLQRQAMQEAGADAVVQREGRTALLAAAARRDATLRGALYSLLGRENLRVSTARPGELSVAYLGDYHTDLVVTVARIGDPGAYGLLLPSLAVGDVVMSAVAKAGERATGDLVRIFQADSSAAQRYAAALTLGKVLTVEDTNRPSLETRRRVRGVLLSGLHDERTFLVRLGAVVGLSSIRDNEVAEQMTRLARTDPFFIMKNGVRSYPVRDAAATWLSNRRNP